MQTLFSRRSWMKGSVMAGLAATTTGCPPRHGAAGSMPSYRVNLICGGMMAFYWDNTIKTLRILIPPPNANAGAEVHEVRFGGLGGTLLRGGSYELDLPGFHQPEGIPYPTADDTKEVVFGRDAHGNSKPTLKPKIGGVYCNIRIPKPTCVTRARIVGKACPDRQFFGTDADTFGIHPDTIAGVYILSYDSVTGPAGLFPENGTPAAPTVFTEVSLVQNVHLYAERPYGSDPMDHIELFNGMFSHADDASKPLNLTHDNTNTGGNVQLPDPPDDLSKKDLLTLVELHGPDSPPRPVDACRRVGDPSNCVNGWVFD